MAEPSDSAGARESDRDSSVRPPHGQVAVGTRPSDTGKAAHSGEKRDSGNRGRASGAAEEPSVGVAEEQQSKLMADEIFENIEENNATEEVGKTVGIENLKVLENIDVEMTVEVGRTEITIRDLLRLNEGSVVELDRLAGDPLDILVNNTKIAKGEVVMIGERFGVRFGEIVDPEKRMESI